MVHHHYCKKMILHRSMVLSKTVFENYLSSQCRRKSKLSHWFLKNRLRKTTHSKTVVKKIIVVLEYIFLKKININLVF